MNFKLKRKNVGTVGKKPEKKLKASAFGRNNESGSGSDSDSSGSESNFKLAMAEKSKKVAKQVQEKDLESESQQYDSSSDSKSSSQAKPKPNSIVNNILTAKRLRDHEHLAAQSKQKELDLKMYLEKNKDAVVFSSEAYQQHQTQLKLVEKQVEEREEQEDLINRSLSPSKSFYSKMIQSRVGTAELEDEHDAEKLNFPQLETIKPVPIIHKRGKTGIGKEKLEINYAPSPGTANSTSSVLLSSVMTFIKSKLTDDDINEEKRKYWDRTRSLAHLTDIRNK
ncbi:hypothetical protein CLIB1423_02S02938 [[Candida] railenensis]|uniref:Nuclear speckle splicing regulatory protein 1 N-terminal domain-containing protein n=1 Tax=[Candida] railenensis TaxID=45579 RepID=A0A9P0QL77_9ASCO|nr:hypothetical protein CLIB1423_02S02938 [[Candida] railenensis]